MALVTASGPRGLSAFMPESRAMFAREGVAGGHEASLRAPVLPLTDTWQAADFSLVGVMAEYDPLAEHVDLRPWVLRLLARYLYITGMSSSEHQELTLGRSPVAFHMVSSPNDAMRVTMAIDEDRSTSILGLNDNELSETRDTRDILTAWFERRWPVRGWWERSDV